LPALKRQGFQTYRVIFREIIRKNFVAKSPPEWSPAVSFSVENGRGGWRGDFIVILHFNLFFYKILSIQMPNS
ncbi:MAG: hypothetical protein ACP5D7_25215, partial [Limnospira sp.]